jgi:Protein of unknown function (DUF3152)
VLRNLTRGSGVYTLDAGGTARHGSGKLVTYRVEAETGIGQSAPVFAAAVDATLADESGWTSQGRWSVQRVAGEDADIVIRLATSAAVGEVCEAAGLEGAAYSSCRTRQFVMINLDRWMHAVPEYRGEVALYRQYLINHEVGHGMGLGHQSCPGPGRPSTRDAAADSRDEGLPAERIAAPRRQTGLRPGDELRPLLLEGMLSCGELPADNIGRICASGVS